MTAEILQKERKGYPRSFVKRSKDGQWMGGVNNLMVLNEKGRVIYLKFFLETEDDAKVLNSLTELKYLEILGNIYVDETLNLDQLEKLEEIFFIRNIIKNLVFAKNNNLKFFSSTSSVLEDINFEDLKELEYFDVNNAKIKDVSGLKYSKDLKILRVVNRELVGLPVLTDWPNLEYLKVKSDGIKSMPGLAQAKKLKYLLPRPQQRILFSLQRRI